MKQAHRQIKEWLEEFLPQDVFKDVQFETGGKHLHVYVPAAKLKVIAPQTPSDHRWFLNWRSDFKRRWNAASERGLVPC